VLVFATFAGFANAGDMPVKAIDSFNYVVGTQTIGAAYQFTKEPRLVETAEGILAMGSNILKFSLAPQPEGDVKTQSLTETAERDPVVRKVLNLPFASYVLWAYPLSAPAGEPFSPNRLPSERREIYDLTRHLLQTYNNTGKSFYLGNWEGDWMLTRVDPNYVPNRTEVTNMIEWGRTRQKAVDDACRETPHQNVHVYYFIEVNRVFDAMDGKIRVANQVLPLVNPDFVSYSSYDAQHGDIETNYRRALDYLEARLAPKPGITGKRVFIGEYGLPSLGNSPQAQVDLARHVMRAGLSWGCPFILYWEFYNNEVTPDGKQRGFWMIDDHGERQPIYDLHRNFYERARKFVTDFTAVQGRNPTRDEYAAAALAWISDLPSASPKR
jgi:hypothetical protein